MCTLDAVRLAIQGVRKKTRNECIGIADHGPFTAVKPSEEGMVNSTCNNAHRRVSL